MIGVGAALAVNAAISRLPEGGNWLYEIHLDGYRALGNKRGDRTDLIVQNGKNLGTDFPAVVEALKTIRAGTAMLDGEVVALDEHGTPSRQLLQNRNSAAITIVYYAFDLLNIEGEDCGSE